MTTYAEIAVAARAVGLAIVGAFHPTLEDRVPDAVGTLVLLGADGPDLWEAFAASPEHMDGAEHGMDRWSARVIGDLAGQLDATALFPFGGPPWNAFQHWAVRGEDAVSSPVRMQATAARGLWASYRGALAFAGRIALPDRAAANPCLDCAAPCLTTCPVEAFAGDSYNIPRCTAHVQSPAGTACQTGCLVRKACPAGHAMELPEAQRRFHMTAFLRAQG